uniref:Uncharacterized protein n=1 Tax=Knipowitschia caucasica TaxID=637954 RepID=A0AAV2L8M4_KNICA
MGGGFIALNKNAELSLFRYPQRHRTLPPGAQDSHQPGDSALLPAYGLSAYLTFQQTAWELDTASSPTIRLDA